MSRTLESLRAEVMSLAPAERARLLDQIIESLDRDAEAEGAWDQVALQRESEIESGSVTGVPLEDVIARLEARFPG
ncbi:addiction module protein [Zoogloea sp.]|uniref:addiction module protein n=1 Tax=Zoogloea sp. TaxID=49181 RepID=UPI002C80F50D|nr:addiction module protein [Hyphomonadaceae bacterium]